MWRVVDVGEVPVVRSFTRTGCGWNKELALTKRRGRRDNASFILLAFDGLFEGRRKKTGSEK
jgi:hypothetical protein